MDDWMWHPWQRRDELVGQIQQEAVDHHCLPETITLVFHEHGLSALVRSPDFSEDTADAITDGLCDLLPALRARGLVVVWPALYVDDEHDPPERFLAMKVHTWDAEVPHCVVSTLWPVPILDTPVGEPMEFDPPDPWSKRLVGALTDPDPLSRLGIGTGTFGSGLELLVVPGGPLDGKRSGVPPRARAAQN